MYAVGIDGMAYLRSENSFDRLVMMALTEERLKIAETMQKNQAIQIANAVSKLFK